MSQSFGMVLFGIYIDLDFISVHNDAKKNLAYLVGTWSITHIPYYRKLTLHEIKVLEINANLMENDFRIKKINAKDEVEFHNKGN